MTTTRAGSASRLVTRREAEPLLGYAPSSLKAVMQQQRGRWPDPVACRVKGRALLYELEALRAVVRPGAVRSRRPAGADADGLMTCLSCGRRFRSLGPHLARAHDMTAAEYRAEHCLPASAALMATEARAALSQARTAAMASNPEMLDRMRAAALPQQELARRSADSRTGTNDLPAVRAARAAGARRTLPAAQQARRAALEAKAQAAGFKSVAAAIEATRHLPSRAAATQIGIGASTVKRWRQHFEHG
ncbi:MucR family transcriptional regulator [Streptomyces sp. BE147]|uniref:MucR family transcriptional regulator n=1 Tax=Streptomyces sp. BE147 TaxID=3002524 RepID=UPI002E768D31|nr:MucR family transcriptional regulator [Streptomyces sp. BE147]MEE1737030.1 MucR family transcriptional regulator [Streptomyces sp. BE147]